VSKNAGNHVFDVRGDLVWYRGAVQRETAATWFLTNGRRCQKSKSDVLVPASVDPSTAEKAFKDTIKDHAARVAAARDEYQRLAKEAKGAAIAAMLAAREARS